MPVRCSLKEGDMIKGVQVKSGIPVRHGLQYADGNSGPFQFKHNFSHNCLSLEVIIRTAFPFEPLQQHS